MSFELQAVAGDECVCPCHRDPSIHHVMACCAECDDCTTRVRTPVLDTHRPRRCAGFRAGRVALKADAVVCVLAGVALVVVGFVHALMPVALHLVFGVALVLWGLGLWLLPTRWPLRLALSVVAGVNLIATSALVIAGSLTETNTALWWTLLGAAVVVVAFAMWEWLVLRKTADVDTV